MTTVVCTGRRLRLWNVHPVPCLRYMDTVSCFGPVAAETFNCVLLYRTDSFGLIHKVRVVNTG